MMLGCPAERILCWILLNMPEEFNRDIGSARFGDGSRTIEKNTGDVTTRRVVVESAHGCSFGENLSKRERSPYFMAKSESGEGDQGWNGE